ALGRALNVQEVRLAPGRRAAPRSWTLLLALATWMARSRRASAVGGYCSPRSAASIVTRSGASAARSGRTWSRAVGGRVRSNSRQGSGTGGRAMTAAMQPRGMALPKLTPAEMSDIVAFLYSVRYFGNAGNMQNGWAVATNKGCLTCHTVRGERGKPASDI